MWHCSNLWDVFVFCYIRSKDAAKALKTTFFLCGLCGSAFLTFFIAFPRLCLDMSETSTITGLCAKEGLLSFSFSLLLSHQHAVASLCFALNVIYFVFSCKHLLCQAPSLNILLSLSSFASPSTLFVIEHLIFPWSKINRIIILSMFNIWKLNVKYSTHEKNPSCCYKITPNLYPNISCNIKSNQDKPPLISY